MTSDTQKAREWPVVQTGTYRKTATITAVQYDGTNATKINGVCTGECVRNGLIHEGEAAPHIHTLENKNGHLVSVGDVVATGIDGEHWAIKPDIFVRTYTKAIEPIEVPALELCREIKRLEAQAEKDKERIAKLEEALKLALHPKRGEPCGCYCAGNPDWHTEDCFVPVTREALGEK